MFTPIGALTSKPYAFVSRPWEINSSEGIDFFDSFLSTIRIDERGLKVIRILPVSNSFNNEVWISDRIRFCYSFQNNQVLVDNFIFYDFSHFLISSKQTSIIFYLSFSKITSISCEFGTPTSLEFQSFFFFFLSFFNKFFHIVGSSFSKSSKDFRTSFFSSDLKTFSSSITDAFFIVNFNTRFSLPVLNSLLKFSFSNSKYPTFFFGSSFYSNFSSHINFGSTFRSLTNFITFKTKFNKLFFTQPFSSNFFFSSKDFSNFFFNNFSYPFYKPNFKLFPLDFDSSSIISSELNLVQNNFSNLSTFYNDYNFISYNSSFEYNSCEQAPKFIFSIESNFDFSISNSTINNSKYNLTPDLLISFPNIFSFASTFISVDGFCKSSNNFKKLPAISSSIFSLFNNFFPFIKNEAIFHTHFFKLPNTFFFHSDSKLPIFNIDFKSNLFNSKYFFSSDSFFSSESARSHYLRSPYSRFSTPLVLQYSRLRSSVFNHLYLLKKNVCLTIILL